MTYIRYNINLTEYTNINNNNNNNQNLAVYTNSNIE